MKPLISEAIVQYAAARSGPVSPLLEELEKETYEKMDDPQMLTGRTEGLFLKMLVQMTGARTVVDIGTFTGYSALMMAEGLPEGSTLLTCEASEEHAAFAARYFRRSPHGGKIDLRKGPAIETLKDIRNESVDFIFIDADKPSYPAYFREGMRMLKKGGLIAADNALWSGKVLSPDDEDSRSVAQFNDMVANDERAEKTLLTIRDGVYLIRKKE